jgi:hydrogenase-4 component F
MSGIDWLAYLTLLIPLAAAILIAVGALLHAPRPVFDALTIALAAASMLASLALVAVSSPEPIDFTAPILPLPWPADFYLDALSVYFLLLVNLVALFAACYVPSFLARDGLVRSRDQSAAFHFLFNLFHFTMVLVPMVDNLVLLWMAVELTTLVSTLLVRFRDDRRALEAAWKYLMITTTGIIFALLGTAFLAAAAQIVEKDLINRGLIESIDLISWRGVQTMAADHPTALTRSDLLTPLVELAFVCALIGYGAKAGFAPLHTWLPDGHGEAPTPVSALLSGVLLKSALFAILRFYTLTNLMLNDEAHFTSSLLLMVGLFSLVVATPFILKRNRFKRLLAYHSLEHMGIIAFGLGIGGSLAVFGALLHALNHALTKALMFLSYGHTQLLYAKQGAFVTVDESSDEPIRGVLKALPLHGGLLAMGGLALVGSPPFNIFQSEFIILWAAITHSPASWVAPAVAVFLVSVTLIFGGLVAHLSRLLLGPAPFHLERESVIAIAPLLILLGVIIVFGFAVPASPLNLPDLIQRSTCVVIQPVPCP